MYFNLLYEDLNLNQVIPYIFDRKTIEINYNDKSYAFRFPKGCDVIFN